MAKYFYYCPETFGQDIIEAFQGRDYETIALTDNDADFFAHFDEIQGPEKNHVALAGHGSAEDGPNMHKGDGGAASITVKNARSFVQKLKDKNINFYSLSCNTGREGTFFELMERYEAPLVAPHDYAEIVMRGMLVVLSIKVCKKCLRQCHGVPPNEVCQNKQPSSKCGGKTYWRYSGPEEFNRTGSKINMP